MHVQCARKPLLLQRSQDGAALRLAGRARTTIVIRSGVPRTRAGAVPAGREVTVQVHPRPLPGLTAVLSAIAAAGARVLVPVGVQHRDDPHLAEGCFAGLLGEALAESEGRLLEGNRSVAPERGPRRLATGSARPRCRLAGPAPAHGRARSARGQGGDGAASVADLSGTPRSLDPRPESQRPPPRWRACGRCAARRMPPAPRQASEPAGLRTRHPPPAPRGPTRTSRARRAGRRYRRRTRPAGGAATRPGSRPPDELDAVR